MSAVQRAVFSVDMITPSALVLMAIILLRQLPNPFIHC